MHGAGTKGFGIFRATGIIHAYMGAKKKTNQSKDPAASMVGQDNSTAPKRVTAKKKAPTPKPKKPANKSTAKKKSNAAEEAVAASTISGSETAVEPEQKLEADQPALDQSVESIQPDIQPSLGVYFKATVQVLRNWVREHRLRTVVIVLVTIAAIGGLSILFRPSPAALTNDDIVVQISRELSISGDGNPVILTVVDEDKVEQPFLDQARDGDKVVLYYKAKKAVLYRPNEKRIVHQGAYTPPEAKVFIRKGTNRTEPLDTAKSQLESVSGIRIASQDTSPRQDYTGVVIVNVTDRYDDKVRELEELFGVEATRLPAGESFPDADILVIVGE